MYKLQNHNNNEDENALAEFLSAYTRFLKKYGVHFAKRVLELLTKEIQELQQ